MKKFIQWMFIILTLWIVIDKQVMFSSWWKNCYFFYVLENKTNSKDRYTIQYSKQGHFIKGDLVTLDKDGRIMKLE